MTKEELEKEAEEYALEWGDKTDGTYACCRDGYLAAATPREKRIEELEELIEKYRQAVSGKNKGDKRKMNEEELFCKLFPEYVVNGKPLSPYFDLFESGYEHFEAYGQCRDSRRIADLEAQIEKMKCCHNCRKFNNLSYDCTCAEVCNEWELRR